MGVSLYRAGNTHIIDGIKCEMKVFDEYLFTSNLETGWYLTPSECYEIEEDTVLSDDEVRLLAKEKGIKYWHNKNIDKLRKEVDEWQPEF